MQAAVGGRLLVETEGLLVDAAAESEEVVRVGPLPAWLNEASGAQSVGAAESPYSIAANGGRNQGFLSEAQRWTSAQLERAIRSFQAQIEAHEAKLADPAANAVDWSARSPVAQEGLLNHWLKEM
jgi:hypothetical protein